MRKYLFYLFLALSTYGGFAQNTAHNDWDLLDKSVRRGHWSWRNLGTSSAEVQDAYLDFCANKSISEVYMYCIPEWQWSSSLKNDSEIGSLAYQDSLAAFITKANARGVKVWALYYNWAFIETDEEGNYLYRPDGSLMASVDTMGNVPNNEHITAANQIMDAVGKFNQRHPNGGFHGVQFDQEPKSERFHVPYLDYCKTATQRADAWNVVLKSQGARPFYHSAALRPSWVSYETITYEGENNYVAYHYIKNAHHAAMMNYTSNNNNFIFFGSRLLHWADSLPGKKFVSVGIETDDILGLWEGSEYETYADEIYAEDDNTRFNLFESDMDSARGVFEQYASFDRIAIHSDGYIAHWFDGAGIDSVGPAPGGTNFVDLTVDSSPNANAGWWDTGTNQSNLLANGGFEDGDSPWVWGYLGNGRVSSNAQTGTYSGKIVYDNQVARTVTGLKPNQQYVLSVGVKAANIGSVSYIILEDYDGASAYQSTTVNAGTTYQTQSVTFTTGASDNSVAISVYNESAGNDLFVDDFELTEVLHSPGLVAANLGFEEGDSPWTWGYLGNGRVAENPYSGTYAGKVVYDNQVIRTFGELKPNSTYKVSAYLKTSSSGGTAYLIASDFDGASSQISITASTDSIYNIFENTFTTGASDTSAQISVYNESVGNDLFVDDFELMEIVGLVEYQFDNMSFEEGDSPWVWGYLGNGRISGNARTGTYAGEIVYDNLVQRTFTGLQPNTEYSISAFAKAASFGSTGYLIVEDYNGPSSEYSVTINAGTSYSLIQNTFTTGANDNSVVVVVYNESPGNNLYVDDFELVEGSGSARNADVVPIPSKEVAALTIYPNPADNFLRIDLEIESQIHDLMIYDINGKVVLIKDGEDFASLEVNQVDISGLKNGMYMVSVILKNGEQIGRKLVIHRQ